MDMEEKMNVETLPNQKASFFISQERLDDLRLKVAWDGNEIHCDLRLAELFENKSGTVLNGILFGIMDVMMWYAVFLSTGQVFVTRKLDATFVLPVEYDKPYRATGQFIKIKGVVALAMAYIRDNSGNICTKGDAIFCENKEASLAEAIEHFGFTGVSPEMKQFFRSLLSENRGDSQEIRQPPEPEYYPRGPL